MKKKIILIMSVFLVLIIAIGITYAYIKKGNSQSGSNSGSTLECLNTTLTSVNNSIIIANQFPISNEEGFETNPYTFTIANQCDLPTIVSIGLERISSSMSASCVRVAVNPSGDLTDNSVLLSSRPTLASVSGGTNYFIDDVPLAANESKTLDLRVWMDEAVTAETGLNKEFNSKITISYRASK